MATVYEGNNNVNLYGTKYNNSQVFWMDSIHSLFYQTYSDLNNCDCYHCCGQYEQDMQDLYNEAYNEPLKADFKAENDDTFHVKRHGKSIDDYKRHVKQVRKFNAKQMQIKKSFNPTVVKPQPIKSTKRGRINRFETD
jgi:hypothetical protein